MFKANSNFQAGIIAVYLGLLTYVEGCTTIRIQMIGEEKIRRYCTKFPILNWISIALFDHTPHYPYKTVSSR